MGMSVSVVVKLECENSLVTFEHTAPWVPPAEVLVPKVCGWNWLESLNF